MEFRYWSFEPKQLEPKGYGTKGPGPRFPAPLRFFSPHNEFGDELWSKCSGYGKGDRNPTNTFLNKARVVTERGVEGKSNRSAKRGEMEIFFVAHAVRARGCPSTILRL